MYMDLCSILKSVNPCHEGTVVLGGVERIVVAGAVHAVRQLLVGEQPAGDDAPRQRLTLVHFSAQRRPFLWVLYDLQ